VGSYKSNAFGLFDMHGNVFEWCEDWFGGYPAGALVDPKGPAIGGTRVIRGGSFAFNESLARSSIRGSSRSTILSVRFGVTCGFRLVMTP